MIARIFLGGFLLVLGTCATFEVPLGDRGQYGAVGIYYRTPDFSTLPADAPEFDK